MDEYANESLSAVYKNLDMPLMKGFFLTYAMVLDHLKLFRILYKPTDYKRKIRWVASIPGSENLDLRPIPEDYLCLCHEDVAASLAPKYPKVLFLVVTSQDNVPEWVESVSSHVILIAQKGMFFALNAYIQGLFTSNLVWESNLEKVVYNRGNLIDLVESTSTITGNFICITDAYCAPFGPPFHG